jgi:cell division protein FtsN
MSIDATGTESHPFQAELQTHSSVDVQPEPRQPGPPGVGKSAPMPAQGEAGVGGRQRAGSAKRKRVARACAACRTKKTKVKSERWERLGFIR